MSKHNAQITGLKRSLFTNLPIFAYADPSYDKITFHVQCHSVTFYGM